MRRAGAIKVLKETENLPSTEDLHAYKPRSPLGEKLWAQRQEIVKSGLPLLDWDDLEKEIAERRGEREDD